MKRNKYKVVYIEWDDAVSAPVGWIDNFEEWKKTSQFIIKEVGFLLEENSKEIFLASFIKDEDSNTYERQGNVRRIPKGWVKKRILIN